MDKIECYRHIVRDVLMPLAQLRFSSPSVTNEAIFDQERDRYMIVTTGWEGNTKRIYFPFVHLDINSPRKYAGLILVIAMDTEEYAIGETVSAAADMILEKRPDAPLYGVRIGDDVLGRV